MRKQLGFTLIELMLVVAIVSILAAIAIPSYNDQVQRGRRADGKAALMRATGLEERFFTQYISYTDVIVGPGGCAGSACGLNLANTASSDDFYVMSIATLPAGCAPGTAKPCRTYELTATPNIPDAKCSTLTLTNTGQKKSTGTGGDVYCWR